ncbi:MAG: hypothetical protein ACKVPY_07680 [Paracoccaceae bacterium]
MLRITLLALSLSPLAVSAAFGDVDKFSKVTVTADLTAIKNVQAAAYWATLAPDLENAIVARLGGRVAEDGGTISVDLREVELSSSFDRALNAADSVLVGQVKVDAENANYSAYEMSVSLGSAKLISADGQSVTFSTIDTPEAYRTLVDAFADGVVERLN